MQLVNEHNELNQRIKHLDALIDVYNGRLGPTDEHVVKLKNEVRKLEMLLLDLMVKEQELWALEGIIE